MAKDKPESSEEFLPDINIGGPGIISVSSADVARSKEGRRQIEALEKLVKNTNLFRPIKTA